MFFDQKCEETAELSRLVALVLGLGASPVRTLILTWIALEFFLSRLPCRQLALKSEWPHLGMSHTLDFGVPRVSNLLIICSFLGECDSLDLIFCSCSSPKRVSIGKMVCTLAFATANDFFLRLKLLVFKHCMGETFCGHGGKRKLTFGMSEKMGFCLVFLVYFEAFWPVFGKWAVCGTLAIQVSSGVCADGVKVKFSILLVNCSCLPLS